MDTTINSLAGLPAFFAYFLVGAILLVLFATIYIHLTPHREFSLIRAGNTAAAIGFAGAVLGYSIPLASAIAHSVSFVDMVIWAMVALAVQVVVIGIVRVLMPNVFKDIDKGKISPAVFLASVSVVAGVINSASMSY